MFIRITACWLADPLSGLLHQGLRACHCGHTRLGCYRLERKLPGGFTLPLEFCAFPRRTQTAIQTGFSFLWASAQWLYPYFKRHGATGPRLELDAMTPVNLAVTFTVLALGVVALYCGLRKRFPKYVRFLGYTRFSNYFMITIFPIQVGALKWTWDNLIAIALFAVPVWLVLHFGLMPVRNR